MTDRVDEVFTCAGCHQPFEFCRCPKMHASSNRVEGNALELSEHWLATRNRVATMKMARILEVLKQYHRSDIDAHLALTRVAEILDV